MESCVDSLGGKWIRLCEDGRLDGEHLDVASGRVHMLTGDLSDEV